MKKVKTSHELLHEKMLAQKEEQGWNIAKEQLKLKHDHYYNYPDYICKKKQEVLFTDAENSLALTLEADKLFQLGKSFDEVRDYIADNKQSIIDDFNNLNK